MKPILKLTIITASLALALSPAKAEEDHAHDHGHAHGTVTVPATLPDLWAAIEKEKGVLEKAVVSQDAHGTHDAVDTLTAYTKALPEQAGSLDEAAKKRIEGQSKNLLRILDNLHHATEGPDWAKAQAELPKLDGVLKLLSTQIPPKS